MSGRIKDDQAYEKSLKWLVEKAEILENPDPLAPAEEYQELMRKYDLVASELLAYRGICNAQEQPNQTTSPPEPVNTQPEQKTPEKTHTDVTSALSAFLDDE